MAVALISKRVKVIIKIHKISFLELHLTIPIGFFTLNGEFLGVAYKGIPGNQYYATIGFRNPLAKVRANFSGPFQFNFEVRTCLKKKKKNSLPVIHDLPLLCVLQLL